MVYTEDILNKQDKKGEKDFTLSSIGQGTTTGALVGLVGGILFAYFQKKQYIDCMLIGTIAGGAISRILLVK